MPGLGSGISDVKHTEMDLVTDPYYLLYWGNYSAAHNTKLAFLSKDLNEISEHATNIAELVTFMVDGKEISHMDMHERRATRQGV